MVGEGRASGRGPASKKPEGDCGLASEPSKARRPPGRDPLGRALASGTPKVQDPGTINQKAAPGGSPTAGGPPGLRRSSRTRGRGRLRKRLKSRTFNPGFGGSGPAGRSRDAFGSAGPQPSYRGGPSSGRPGVGRARGRGLGRESEGDPNVTPEGREGGREGGGGSGV